MEGDSVTLHTDIEINTDDHILWKFVTGEATIAHIFKALNRVTIYDGVLDERFIDRLQLNNQTGDLTITNITTEDSGLYQIVIRNTEKTSYRFHVTVYARMPVPVITRDSSSVSNCVLMCSVMNVRDVRDVSLSWYKGNSLLSSISVSDLNISSISLHLKCLNDSYSCVVNNPISNQTQHLNITDVCQPCSGESQVMFVFIHSLHLCFILVFLSSDSVNSCATTEAVIRLVVSALVGVAAVAASVVLIYDIRSRRDEQKRTSYINNNHI
ncbi:SLAM family member 9-like isoform X1 [Paramisgurnus dabryanus]|uniref:SLAM family member 9-like isoform X1 n=1 Tax=Paramisgurnus dabryanus TaxID=90735 RepID=UPI003CCF5AC1